jgi:hypothetical protein
MSRKYLAVAVILGAMLVGAAPPASADGPFQFYPVTPCRLVDTRVLTQAPGGYGPGLASLDRKAFPVQGNCLVPVGAKAVALNVTVAKPTAQTSLSQGNLGLYPSEVPPPPNTSVINFAKGTTALANGAIVPLADQSVYAQDLTVRAFLLTGGKVEVILDVTGYFQ